jgi:hypothetical protein
MAQVSYQVVATRNCDINAELLAILKESLEDTYADVGGENLESNIQIKYIKSIGNNERVIAGFCFLLDEEIRDKEIIIDRINDRLSSSEYIDVVFKFEDTDLFSRLGMLYSDLFEIEMKLREAITFIYVDTYGSDCYNLLRETNITRQYEGRSNLRKDNEQRKQFLSNRLENEFFHIQFSEYSSLNELKPLKMEELTNIIEASEDFEDFQQQMITRGITKEPYLDFISSIKIDMGMLENVRNCVAHNRTPSDDDLENFNRVKEELLRKIDAFLDSLGQRE